ncbi:hypothetical protein [Pseudomonas lini]|uniref:hypothetical protein n=1 Tax=Pseudomonas lini TaxID=163011 RepID=UPI0012E23C88|nr:hypothetical protein [Pseudomonas lini]
MNAQLYNSFFGPSEAVGRFKLAGAELKSGKIDVSCLTKVRDYKALTGMKVASAVCRPPVKKSQRIQEYFSIV